MRSSAQATAVTRRVSLTSGGRQGNRASFLSSISTDGRFVVLLSRANNLVEGDGNSRRDVFVRGPGAKERVG
jgi:hypothetical protein